MLHEGERNDGLIRFCGAMRAKGASLDVMTAAALAHNREVCMPPLADDEVGKIAQSAANYAPSCAVARPRDCNRATVVKSIDLQAFLAMQFPPRSCIVQPWLPDQGLTLIYGPRGILKTWFGLSIAVSVAAGEQFLGWHVERPRNVAYLDGEMPARVLQERLRKLLPPGDLIGSIRLITPDLQPDGILDLSSLADQESLEPHLQGIDLIIGDNLSCLVRTGKENEGESWLPVQGWALKQRAKGRTVCFLHHANKGGQQRGSSRREDVLDTVISLRRPQDYQPSEGAKAELHFEKSRGFFGDDAKPLEIALTSDGDKLTWTYQALEDSMHTRIVSLANEGLSQKDIAIELDLNKSTVSRHFKSAQEHGELHGCTPRGRNRATQAKNEDKRATKYATEGATTPRRPAAHSETVRNSPRNCKATKVKPACNSKDEKQGQKLHGTNGDQLPLNLPDPAAGKSSERPRFVRRPRPPNKPRDELPDLHASHYHESVIANLAAHGVTPDASGCYDLESFNRFAMEPPPKSARSRQRKPH